MIKGEHGSVMRQYAHWWAALWKVIMLYIVACGLCQLSSRTAGEGKTSLSDCICDAGHFALTRDNASNLTCAMCPVGTNCTAPGASLQTLELLEGYWRIGANSADVRRCPGALSGSRCVGGRNDGVVVGFGFAKSKYVQVFDNDEYATETRFVDIDTVEATLEAHIPHEGKLHVSNLEGFAVNHGVQTEVSAADAAVARYVSRARAVARKRGCRFCAVRRSQHPGR